MDGNTLFGPGQPITPRSGYSQRPRSMDYPIAVNTNLSPRERWGRTPLLVIKGIIDAYDIARMCINHKIDEIRSMEPLFVPAKGISGDVDDALDTASLIMSSPDRENDWLGWIGILLENALRYDAAPLYRRRNRFGEIIGFENIDGTTLFPFVDEHGRRPLSPAPAYFQKIQGMDDVHFTAEDVTYNRFRPQADSPFGLAPIESILLTANTDIKFQWHFLQMFTEGSIPGGFMELPPDISSPDQVGEWQDYWDSMTLGDQSILHKLVAVPGGSKITETRPKTFDKTFPQYLAVRTAGAFGVVPQDIGIIEDVNRATGETQTDLQFRVNTLPWVLWVQNIVNRYLKYDLRLPVEMKLDTGRETADSLQDALRWQVLVETAAASPDEMRTALTGLPIDNDRPVPRGFISSKTGWTPLSAVLQIAGKIDPETAAPVDDVPLSAAPFDLLDGAIAIKKPGALEYTRAPQDPDEPNFPQLEVPIPATGTITPANPAAAPDAGDEPVAKAAATGGVTAATGLTGVDDNESREGEYAPDVPAELEELRKAELSKFRKFRTARAKRGTWRDFEFSTVAEAEARRLNTEARGVLRKAAGQVVAAGLAVQAADTGRVLMMQRALDDTDPAGGTLEFPGGCLEDFEAPFDAAVREWQEEVGALLPAAAIATAHTSGPGWQSPDGVYCGYLLTVGSETFLRMGARVNGMNPDDPDGDMAEAIMWVDPETIPGNPMLRPELAASIGQVMPLLLPSVEVESESLVDLVEDNGIGVLDDIDPEADAAPLAEPLAKSWRDNGTGTPQSEVDIPVTDYYAPLIRAGLVGTVAGFNLPALISRLQGTTVEAGAVPPAITDAVAASGAAVLYGALTNTLTALVADGYTAGAHAAASQLAPHVTVTGPTVSVTDGIDWSAWKPGSPPAAAKAADGAMRAALDQVDLTIKGISDTTIDTIGNHIARGLEAGSTAEDIADGISDVVGSESRALMIANTETTRAITAATQDVYGQNGVGMYDMITADADDECVTIAANGPYKVGDPTGIPPIHPFCRCANVPVISSIVGANIAPVDDNAIN